MSSVIRINDRRAKGRDVRRRRSNRYESNEGRKDREANGNVEGAFERLSSSAFFHSTSVSFDYSGNDRRTSRRPFYARAVRKRHATCFNTFYDHRIREHRGRMKDR